MTNLIAALIFAILGAGSYRYLYLPYKRRTNALSRLSPLDFSKDPVYLCHGLIAPAKPSNQFTVAQGDLSAITLGYKILVDNYGGERARIKNCMTLGSDLDEVSNLLSISGPRWNSITDRYMTTLGCPLSFSDDRKAVIAHEPDGTREIFRNTYRSSGDPEICYGIVVGAAITRHGDRAQNVLICAGSNSFTTYGSVIILDELRHGRSLQRIRHLTELKNQPRWAMIVRVQNLSPDNAEPRGQLPFERGQLEVRIERSFVTAEFCKAHRLTARQSSRGDDRPDSSEAARSPGPDTDPDPISHDTAN